MENNDLEIITWPSGITTQAGGTRTEIKLDRPWQVGIPHTTECALCRRYEADSLSVLGLPAEWRVIKNAFTPHRFHRLIVPSTCWPEDSLRTLGGAAQIANAILAAMKIMEQSREDNLWMGIHIGYLAGQNVSHLHWHLLRTTEAPPVPTESTWSAVRDLQTQSLIVVEDDTFVVSAGGVRSGALIIAPKEFGLIANKEMISTFAELLNNTITLCNRKLMSTTGKGPDFKIAVHLYSGRLDLAEYVPILNNWGFTESYQFTFGSVSEVPLILPWPHYKTAEYLKAGA